MSQTDLRKVASEMQRCSPTTVKLPPKVRERYNNYCRRNASTISQMTRSLIEQHLAKVDRENSYQEAQEASIDS